MHYKGLNQPTGLKPLQLLKYKAVLRPSHFVPSGGHCNHSAHDAYLDRQPMEHPPAVSAVTAGGRAQGLFFVSAQCLGFGCWMHKCACFDGGPHAC